MHARSTSAVADVVAVDPVVLADVVVQVAVAVDLVQRSRNSRTMRKKTSKSLVSHV